MSVNFWQTWAESRTSSLRSLCVVFRPGTLHDFRSHEIADQLTLLDAELFYKIEVRRLVCVRKSLGIV